MYNYQIYSHDRIFTYIYTMKKIESNWGASGEWRPCASMVGRATICVHAALWPRDRISYRLFCWAITSLQINTAHRLQWTQILNQLDLTKLWKRHNFVWSSFFLGFASLRKARLDHEICLRLVRWRTDIQASLLNAKI